MLTFTDSVSSQLGVGSTFWVELRLGVGQKAIPRQPGGSDSEKAYNDKVNGEFSHKERPKVSFRASANGLPSTPITEQPNAISSGYAGFLPLLPTHAASALRSIMDQGIF